MTTAVNSLTRSKSKPKDCKSAALDKALATWEAAEKKTAPDAGIPAKLRLSDDETLVKDCTTLVAVLKERQTARDAVGSAAAACAGDLRRQAANKQGADWDACSGAASTASAIAGTSADMSRKLA
jgi:hypothetical protein